MFGKNGIKQKGISEMDTTHVVFLSLSTSFFLFSIVNTVLSIFNLSYAINNKILLCFALYAVLFSFFTSSYVNPKVKSIGLFTLPLSTAVLVFLAVHFKVDLNGLNNGLSLIALSISISLLPFRTLQESTENEMKEKMTEQISYLKGQIARLNDTNKKDRDELMKNWKDAVNQLGATVEDYKKSNSEVIRLRRELEETNRNFSDFAMQCEYEKKDIVEEHELYLYENGLHIEELERQIEELKKQKEDT